MVPDDSLLRAAKALKGFQPRLSPCANPVACIASSTCTERNTPPPAFHQHVDGSEVTVGLYLQSETLWFLPPLDSSFLSPTTATLAPPFALASDQGILPPWRPGRGQGVFQPGLDPVVVIKSHVLLEAFLRLYARDAAKRVGGCGMAMIGYMELYVDDDGLLDASQLPEPLRGFYKELHSENMTKPLRQWTMELRVALGMPSDRSENDFS